MIVYLLRVQQWPALPHPPNHSSMKKSSWASPPWLGPGSFTLSVDLPPGNISIPGSQAFLSSYADAPQKGKTGGWEEAGPDLGHP